MALACIFIPRVFLCVQSNDEVVRDWLQVVHQVALACIFIPRVFLCIQSNDEVVRDWLQVVRQVALACIFILRVFLCILLLSFSSAACCPMSQI